MEYNLSFKSSVKKDLKGISKRNLITIFDGIQKLKNDPFLYPKLKGNFEGMRKFRVGDFRIIYTIIENEILILRISDRKQAYKK